MMNGTLDNINDFRRPIESLNSHPMKAPIGCDIDAKLTTIQTITKKIIKKNILNGISRHSINSVNYLPIQDACDGVIRSISSAFNLGLNPSSDGMTSVGNPSNRPVFSVIRFRDIVAKICNSCHSHHLLI